MAIRFRAITLCVALMATATAFPFLGKFGDKAEAEAVPKTDNAGYAIMSNFGRTNACAERWAY